MWTAINIEFDVKNADGILGKNNAWKSSMYAMFFWSDFNIHFYAISINYSLQTEPDKLFLGIAK